MLRIVSLGARISSTENLFSSVLFSLVLEKQTMSAVIEWEPLESPNKFDSWINSGTIRTPRVNVQKHGPGTLYPYTCLLQAEVNLFGNYTGCIYGEGGGNTRQEAVQNAIRKVLKRHLRS